MYSENFQKKFCWFKWNCYLCNRKKKEELPKGIKLGFKARSSIG